MTEQEEFEFRARLEREQGAAAAPQPGVPAASPYLDKVVKAQSAGLPAPTAPEPQRPKAPDRTVAERIKGFLEAAVETASQVAGAVVGSTGGAVGGLAAALGGAQFKGAPGQNVGLMANRALEQGASEGSERVAGVVRSGLRGMLWGDAPMSEAGQENMDQYVTPAMQQLPSMMAAPRGTVGMSPQQGLGLKPALQAVGDTARAAGSKVVDAALPTMDAGTAARVQKATAEGIPVSPHQLTENRVLQFLGESAENVPGAFGGRIRKARSENFSRGLAALIDPEAAKGVKVLDSSTFRALQDNAGRTIDGVFDRAQPVPKSAFEGLIDAVRDNDPAIQDTIANFAKRVETAADQHGGTVPGSTLRELRSDAARAGRETKASKSDLSAAWDRVTKRLDDALEPYAVEGDIPVLAEARRQYAVSKALEPLVADHPDGIIPPQALHDALTATQKGKTRMARGTAGEQGEYARLGREILTDNVLSDAPTRHSSFHGVGAMATGGLATAGYFGGWPLAAGMYAGSALYNLIGPRAARWAAERYQRRTAPVEAPAAPGLELAPEGPLPPRGGPEAPASPLGDLTPDWETAPGAAPARAANEVVPAEGLHPAIDEVGGPARVRPAGAAVELPPPRGAGQEIPAVPGRPDLPEAMVAGGPAEVAATAPAGEAMQAPTAALARQQQEAARLRSQTEHPEVQRVLDEHAKKLERAAAEEVAKQKRMADAAELRKAASLTKDPEIQAALHKRAAALEGAEPVPAGKAKEVEAPTKPAKVPEKPLPVPEATEVTPEVVEPVAPAATPRVQGKDLVGKTAEDLGRMHEDAVAHNKRIEVDLVRREFGDAQAREFEGWSRRKRDNWLESNLTVEQDSALQRKYIDEETIAAHRDAVNDFANESPEALGRSIALRARKVDTAGFFETPDGHAVTNALKYAKAQGWNLDKVMDGMRARAAEWAGGDAPELFRRLFKEATAPKIEGTAAPQKPKSGTGKSKMVVGRVYRDANGNKAIYLADGTWKEIP